MDLEANPLQQLHASITCFGQEDAPFSHAHVASDLCDLIFPLTVKCNLSVIIRAGDTPTAACVDVLI